MISNYHCPDANFGSLGWKMAELANGMREFDDLKHTGEEKKPIPVFLEDPTTGSNPITKARLVQ
jgi:hypothetical protein